MTITTVKKFIEIFGGNRPVAALFNTTPQNVCNWGIAGRFPAWAAHLATQFAEKRGETLHRDLTKPHRPERKQRKRTKRAA